MATNPFADDWVPAQVKKPEVIDFRAISYGPRGFKAKNRDRFSSAASLEADMEIDAHTPVRLGTPSTSRLGTGKISKRCWKQRGTRAAAMNTQSSSKSVEDIKAERLAKKRFQQMKKDIREARGARLREKRERREKAELKKKKNREKSAVVEEISSTKTLKKMLQSKKQRARLMQRGA